jgi:hypothetical protein
LPEFSDASVVLLLPSSHNAALVASAACFGQSR